MQVVSRIVSRQQSIRMHRIGSQFVEIDDRIEMSRLPDPLIDRSAISFIRSSRMIVVRAHVWSDRRPEYLDAVSMRAKNDLFIGRDHLMNEIIMLRLRLFSFTR